MRATMLTALLLGGALSLITFDAASSLPALSARPAAKSAGLVEEAKTQRYRKARKYGQRRPYYVPAHARTNSAIGNSIRRSATRSRLCA